MKAAEIIKACARSIKDFNFRVFSSQEWFEILKFQVAELYPEIGFTGTKEDTIDNLYAQSDEYQLDLSSIDNLEDVKEVFLLDSDGNQESYDNWIFDKDTKILDLDPSTSKIPDKSLQSYSSYKVVYILSRPEIASLQSNIELSPAKLNILKDICVRAALEALLNDNTKLDRYRVLVGRMNEYALMAWIDRLSTQIELYKRKLVDTHPVKSY